MRQQQKKRSLLKTFAFGLMGIFIGGLALRIILFFIGIQVHPPYSHMINYPIIGAILIYSGLQVYYKSKKHRFL